MKIIHFYGTPFSTFKSSKSQPRTSSWNYSGWVQEINCNCNCLLKLSLAKVCGSGLGQFKGSKKIWSTKNFRFRENFESEKFWVKYNFMSKKNLRSKKNFGSKTFWVQRISFFLIWLALTWFDPFQIDLTCLDCSWPLLTWLKLTWPVPNDLSRMDQLDLY